MKLAHISLILILSSAIVFAASSYIAREPAQVAPSAASKQETSYNRVLRTGTLRCGYEYWDAAIMRNENTGDMYGPWVDIMKALGKATGLKIEWASQVGWSDVGAALKSGKIDAMCAGMWTSATKSKEISFSTPLAYQAIEAFVRDDDHRFDDEIEKLNDPSVKIVVIDNDNSDFIAQEDFPKAQRIALSALNGTDSEELMQVMTSKADVAFTVTGLWQQFNKSNPGKLRRLAPDHKLRSYGLAIAVDNDDARLLQIINSGAQEIQNSGTLDKILDNANFKWPDMYIKPLKPFL